MTELIKPKVKLTGKNGNAYVIMGIVKRALKKAGYPEDKIKEYETEAKSGNYDNFLQVTMRWVDVI